MAILPLLLSVYGDQIFVKNGLFSLCSIHLYKVFFAKKGHYFSIFIPVKIYQIIIVNLWKGNSKDHTQEVYELHIS